MRRRTPSDLPPADRGSVALPRGPRHTFVTIDPERRVDRRASLVRRAQVATVLARLEDPLQRRAYLESVRAGLRTSVA